MARGDRARNGPPGLEPDIAHAPSPGVPLATQVLADMVAVARQAPRAVPTFKARIQGVLELDPSQVFTLIWTREIDGVLKRGPSARLAELLLYGWGNIRASANILSIGRDYVEAEGVCLDVETNHANAITLRRSTRRPGRRMSHEEVLNVASAAGAIARRNAILATIPSLAWTPILVMVETLMVGEIEDLVVRRDELLERLDARGAPEERVLRALGVESRDAIDMDVLVTLQGLAAAIADGGADPEEMFPDLRQPLEPMGEGFRIGHVEAETGIATPGGVLLAAPDPVELAEEPEPELALEEVLELSEHPVTIWTRTLATDLQAVIDPQELERMSFGLKDRAGGDQGLFLAGRALISARRRELASAGAPE